MASPETDEADEELLAAHAAERAREDALRVEDGDAVLAALRALTADELARSMAAARARVAAYAAHRPVALPRPGERQRRLADDERVCDEEMRRRAFARLEAALPPRRVRTARVRRGGEP